MDKVGFHYRLDTEHYSDKDLALWLPRLKELGVSWILLYAPISRAIPEGFISGLKNSKIEPVLHFRISPKELPDLSELVLLLETYQKWGVKYIILFDRPNLQEKWGSEAWAQSDLTERFLDGFLPLAEAVVALGQVPVFPPLEPGGDYWDTIFLRRALDGIKRRASQPLQARLILSAYAGLNGRKLSWGGGGPQSWPESQPYYRTETSQDQQGFRIGEWYLTLSETVLEKRLPILLLGIRGPAPEGQDLADSMVQAASLIARQEVEGLEELPEEVLGGAFFTLTGSEDCCASEHIWYQDTGEPQPFVERFLNAQKTPESKNQLESQPIAHYLLLPSYEWGVADWHLKITKTFIKKHRPTIGFSLEEACQAEQVTVIGGPEQFAEEDLNRLRNQGCLVRRVEGDGPKIASLLAAI
jgi:hypothetical protein